jgi:hypothetical protein
VRFENERGYAACQWSVLFFRQSGVFSSMVFVPCPGRPGQSPMTPVSNTMAAGFFFFKGHHIALRVGIIPQLVTYVSAQSRADLVGIFFFFFCQTRLVNRARVASEQKALLVVPPQFVQALMLLLLLKFHSAPRGSWENWASWRVRW